MEMEDTKTVQLQQQFNIMYQHYNRDCYIY